MKNLMKKSLKFKLMAICLCITLLLGATSFGVLTFLSKSIEKSIGDQFYASADGLSDAIGSQFYERYGDVQAFALNPSLWPSSSGGSTSGKSEMVEVLNQLVALYGIYDLVMIVDVTGKLVAVNSKGPDGKLIKTESLYSKSFSKAHWFSETLAGRTTDDKSKAFTGTYVENIQVDPWVSIAFGEKRLGNSFSASIKSKKGETIGVISNRAGSRWFEAAIKETYHALQEQGKSHSEVALVGRDGTLLYEFDPYGHGSKDHRESVYNFDSLLKFNLVEANVPAAIALKEGKTGTMISYHVRKKMEQIVGFTPVSGPKFVDSLGWGVLVRDDYAEGLAEVTQAKTTFLIVLAIVILLSGFASYWFSGNLAKVLGDLAFRLGEGGNAVSSAAGQIAASASSLSDSSSEQAAAIQETASAIDEVSAMVKKSAENASKSQEVSAQSREAAESGQQAVQDMIQAIDQISSSNREIMTQVEDSNRQISEIVKVIGEIGNKTKVINEIVFQTKLLSFNASVEAARAGEHGKGFAVVAEEVGNLAQMSGNAAKDISSMLDSSIQKVEKIVVDTKSKVERLMHESKSKVESGTETAKRCGESLMGIIKSVQEVDGMVLEISTASQEQAQGVTEINKAMNQLDQVTQANSSAAQQSAAAAAHLNAQSAELKEMVKELYSVITGDGSASTSKPETPKSTDSKPRASSSSGPKGESGSKSGGKVVSIFKNKKEEAPSQQVYKKAVGNGAEIPLESDPRFEEV